MTQKFLTSVDRPFALVKSYSGTSAPGRRPPSSVVWLEFQNEDGSFDGGEIYMLPNSGISHPYLKPPRWKFSYKHPKVFSSDAILHRFPHKRGINSSDRKEYCGGPTLIEVRVAKKALPITPEITPASEIDNASVILRAINQRGPIQQEALTELSRRGLWLTAEQKQLAGLS